MIRRIQFERREGRIANHTFHHRSMPFTYLFKRSSHCGTSDGNTTTQVEFFQRQKTPKVFNSIVGYVASRQSKNPKPCNPTGMHSESIQSSITYRTTPTQGEFLKVFKTFQMVQACICYQITLGYVQDPKVEEP